MIVVAVQKGLEEIKTALEQKGFHTVYTDEVTQPVTACVYYEEENNLAYGTISSYLQNGLSATVGVHNSGILLINSKGKDPDEIARIIKQRTYSPLF